MRRPLLLALCLGVWATATISLPANAQRGGAADDEDEEEDDDDDILAPRTEEKPSTSTVAPAADKALKVGMMPVVPLGEAGKTLAEQVSLELTKAFNESASVGVLGLALASSSDGPTIDLAAAEKAKTEAEKYLTGSQKLLKKLQFGKAKKAFDVTLEKLEAAAPVLETPELFIEAWLGQAEIAARQAQDDETTIGLSYVVGFNPEMELDQKRFPGLFVNQHRKARDRMLAGEKAIIVVDATAAGAQIFIDGRPVATAPAKISGVYPGSHLVRVVREGLPPWGALITVDAGGEKTVSPGFIDPKKTGPNDDLAQNRLSAESALVVANAAKAQGYKGAIVGTLAKQSSRTAVQLVYVDAASGRVAILPPMKLSGGLLDVGIESLDARARIEELAGAAAPALREADKSEVLIEGANAGAGVTVAEVSLKFDVKKSKDMPTNTRDIRGGGDDDEGGGRTLANTSRGTRKTLDGDRDRYSVGAEEDKVVPEDAPFTEQPWFMPAAITAGVVGAAALLAGTGVALVALKVVPDPRPASGTQVSVSFPTAAAAP